jgi:hypothetical protein
MGQPREYGNQDKCHSLHPDRIEGNGQQVGGGHPGDSGVC